MGSRGGSGFGNSGRILEKFQGRSGHFFSDEILAILANLVLVTGGSALSARSLAWALLFNLLAAKGTRARVQAASSGATGGVDSRGARNLGVNNIPSTQIDV